MFFECFWNRLVETLKKTKIILSNLKKTLLLVKLATIVSPRRARFLFESVEKEAEPQDEDPRKNRQSSRTKTTLHHFYNSLPSLAYSTTRARSRFFKDFNIFSDCLCVCVCVRARAQGHTYFSRVVQLRMYLAFTPSPNRKDFIWRKRKGGAKNLRCDFPKGHARGVKKRTLCTLLAFSWRKKKGRSKLFATTFTRKEIRFVSFRFHSRGYWCLGVHFSVYFSARTKDLFFLRFRPKKKLWLVCVCVCVRSVLPKRGNFWLATRKGSY